MPFFKTHRELRNVKRYETLGNNRMAEVNGIETNDLNAHRDNADPGILTQKKLTNRLRATPLPWPTKGFDSFDPRDVKCSSTKRFPKGEWMPVRFLAQPVSLTTRNGANIYSC